MEGTRMKVHVYEIDADGYEFPLGTADLIDVIPEPNERYKAERYLREVGRYWHGTAGQLTLLMNGERQ
jgi:hypothetical protein